MNRRILLIGLGWLAISAPAFSLSPAEVFEKVSPSVWAVRGLDHQERPFTFGSGVVVGPGRIVTNCHVLAKAKAIQVRRENVAYEASLEHADVERDLCLLSIPNFTAPAVAIAKLSTAKVGNPAYVVGNPEKLALTLSEGLISGLRPEDPSLPPIQTSAPISPGSSGGGLFDEQGRLVGITTLIFLGRARIAQNLNFAVPAEWIAEVPERAKAQLARRRGAPQPALATEAVASPGGLPRVGAQWTYSMRDQYNFRQPFTVQVTGVTGWNVQESISTDSGGAVAASVDAKQVAFASRLINGRPLVELSPYLLASSDGSASPTLGPPANYPIGSSTEPFRVRVLGIQADQVVTVPVGTFNTVRVEVGGERSASGFVGLSGGLMNSLAVVRFRYTAWYAPEVGRYVQMRHEQWSPSGSVSSDELVQLMDFKKL